MSESVTHTQGPFSSAWNKAAPWKFWAQKQMEEDTEVINALRTLEEIGLI